MRVLNFSNVGGEIRGGGVHEVVINYWKYQNQMGLDSSLWFPGNLDDEISIKNQIVNYNGLFALDTFFKADFGILKGQKELLKKMQAFDIIHQHGIWLPISKLTTQAKKDFKIKTIIQPHGYLEPYRLKKAKLKKALSYQLFEKENLEKCDLLLACSYQEYENLRSIFPSKAIAVIPNGISLDFLSQKQNNYFFKDEKYGDNKNLLFLSRLHPIKGLDRLIEIFASMSEGFLLNWNLILAGMGDSRYVKKLEKKINSKNLSNKVFIIGSVFGQEKIDILSSADLLVLPTFSENFGIVVIEALSKGLPVLTTQAAPWKLIEEYNCGFWVPNSAEGIKKGLIKAMSLEEHELKRMGENGRKLVADHFIWEDIVKQTLELYEWLLYGGQHPSFVELGDPNKSNKSIF
jgi:glycosyltransferase involved in cell wall biosynthesis